jgi:hypothetical protein
MSKQKSLFVAAAVAEEKARQISPWQPEGDPWRLAVLGKLAEECNELAGRAARCIIQGLDEPDPASGRSNRDELAREAADVIACIEMAVKRQFIRVDHGRVDEKVDGFRRWHTMIRAPGELS